MGKGTETGKSFLTGVLSKITDPELKAKAEAVFASAAVQTEIGNGVEGQSEIDRQLQDLRTKTTALDTQKAELDAKDGNLTKWHTDLTAWRAANNELVDIGKKAKAAGWNGTGTPPAPTPVVAKPGELPAGALTEEQLQAAITEERGNFLGFQRDQNRLMREHFEKFKEILNIEPLLTNPRVREIGLAGVYQETYKDQLKKVEDDAIAANEARIRADERQKVQASNTQIPYPSVTGSNAGSPLDALKPPVEGGGPVVDAAVTEYNRLQAVRNGAPA